MQYQYNIQTNSLITPAGGTGTGGVGARVSNVPEITFSTMPEWTIQFCTVENGKLTPLNLTGAAAWRAAIDHDYDPETDPLCRSLNDQIDQSDAAAGKIKIRLNANTAAFLAAVKDVRSCDAWFELWGLDQQGQAIHYCKFKIRALMPLDPSSGTEPEEVEAIWADRTWVEARIQGIEIPEPKLSALSDVGNTENAANGQALIYDAAAELWKPGNVSSETAPSTLAELSDVGNTESAANGQALIYDATTGQWKPGNVSSETAPSTLAELSDVGNTESAANGQALIYDAAAELWKPGNIEQASYTAGDGIQIAGNEIRANATLARQATVETAMAGKVDKITGKALSTNDYDNASKNKLANLAAVAVSGSYADLLNKPAIPETLADLADVSDTSAATDGQALLYDAAAEQWKPGNISSGGSSPEVTVTGTPAVAVSAPDEATGTMQVRPVKINSDGSVSWDGPAVTVLYTWGVPEA